MNIQTNIATILFIIIPSLVGFSQEKPTSSWNWKDCIDYARKNNIQVQSAKVTQQSANVDLLQAKAQLFPSLTFSSSQGWGHQKTEQTDGKFKSQSAYTGSYTLNGGLTIYNGGKLTRSIRQQQITNTAQEYQVNMAENDIDACLNATTWPCANLGYFRGGGFSSSYSTQGVMPCTFARVNYVKHLGPTIQIIEGYTVELPEDVNKTLLGRTDPTWPSTWFAPITVPDKVAVSDVYNVMANWGANHGCFVYGHIGEDLVTLASMLRIPVSLHNLSDDRLFRPHAWSAFGTTDLEGADYRACAAYGSLYK